MGARWASALGSRDARTGEARALHGLFDPARVQALVERVYAPGADYTTINKALALVIFQEWFELYLA